MPTSESNPAARRSLSVQFNRLIPATSAEVFNAWTNPDLLKAWIAPGNMIVPNVARDLRTGGAYRIEMQGTVAAHNGEEPVSDEDPVLVAQGVYAPRARQPTRVHVGGQLESGRRILRHGQATG